MTKHTVGPPIVIGYVTGGLSTAYFQQCLTQATHHSLVDPNVIPFIGSPHLSVNRNMVTMRFLRDLRHPWLLMVDDDMVFTTDDIEEMYQAANDHQARLVSGVYFSGMHYEPVAYDLAPGVDPNDFTALATESYTPVDIDYAHNKTEPRNCDAVGAGFLLIHRDLVAGFGDWWDYIGRLGEDMSFCLRARVSQNERPLLVPEVTLGHVKTHVVTVNDYVERRQAEEEVKARRNIVNAQAQAEKSNLLILPGLKDREYHRLIEQKVK